MSFGMINLTQIGLFFQTEQKIVQVGVCVHVSVQLSVF